MQPIIHEQKWSKCRLEICCIGNALIGIMCICGFLGPPKRPTDNTLFPSGGPTFIIGDASFSRQFFLYSTKQKKRAYASCLPLILSLAKELERSCLPCFGYWALGLRLGTLIAVRCIVIAGR
jgi:hypothetical protein